MPIMPGVTWAPLPEAGAPDGYEKSQLIIHSTGDNGTARGTAKYFGGSTPNESTFIVGRGPDDPTLQIMDSSDRADANVASNDRAISVEVVGDGYGGYNTWQRSEIVKIGRWARKTHPKILPRICPAYNQPGFGWHVMFGAPSPWTGSAKICPGKMRIAELKSNLFPAIFSDDEVNGDLESVMLDVASLKFITSPRNTNAWYVTDGMTKRPAGPWSHCETLIQLGLAEPHRPEIGQVVAVIADEVLDAIPDLNPPSK